MVVVKKKRRKSPNVKLHGKWTPTNQEPQYDMIEEKMGFSQKGLSVSLEIELVVGTMFPGSHCILYSPRAN